MCIDVPFHSILSSKTAHEVRPAARSDFNQLKRERTREQPASHSNRPGLIEYAYPFHSQSKSKQGTVVRAALRPTRIPSLPRVDAEEPAQAKKLVIVNNQGR